MLENTIPGYKNIFKFEEYEKVKYKGEEIVIILQRFTVDFNPTYLVKGIIGPGEEFYVDESQLEKI